MTVPALVRIARNHARNALAEQLYLRTGKDLTAPVAIHGIVNETCNYRCRYCECWRLPSYKTEMTVAEWQKALLDLQDFRGRFHIEFSGGEPYLKHGFLELPAFCHDRGLPWGVTTNGSAYASGKVVAATIAARPFNVNISLDSRRPQIHDYVRGRENSLSVVLEGLRKLAAARKAECLNFPIIIKPVVHRLNFRHLPEMVDWVADIGGTAIHFQPVDRWTPETYHELWIDDPDDLAGLIRVRDELLAMKRAGAPVLNSERVLLSWDKHFLEQKAPKEFRPCRVGMRNYFIRPNGDVEVCWYFEPIGNVRDSDARAIWYGERARQRRKETLGCDSLCLFTCLSQKTITDKVKMAWTLLASHSCKPRARQGV